MTEATLRLGRRLPAPVPDAALRGPDWAQASPARIRTALDAALTLPSGGWYAVDASRAVGEEPRTYTVEGYTLVAFRDPDGIVIGHDTCPHLGASLGTGRVCAGKLVCPWHGLALGRAGHGAWKPLPVHDDGVLFWVRMDALYPESALTPRPFIAPRPARFLEGTVRMEAACDARDVIANRLDPWHGAHFHPQAFTNLVVTRADHACLALRVEYRVLGPMVVEVDATFHCPDPRTIVMTIVNGEGTGSVVETHATPVSPGRTVVLETTLASSERLGFRLALGFSRLLRPFVEHVARGLWRDDIAYAERCYALRTGLIPSAIPLDIPSALPREDSRERTLAGEPQRRLRLEIRS